VPQASLTTCAGVHVLQRLLRDADITANFEKTTRGVQCKEHALAQRTKALKRLLALVLFLDRAKLGDVLEGLVPCLFQKNSAIKSSKEVVCRLSTLLLRGEGDILRHLHNLGFVVTFEQHSMDEFDFGVSNLAVDLRDGIRLTRLYEIASGAPRLALCKVCA
jgi:abnormal spindle-like microcephaly-associated protein